MMPSEAKTGRYCDTEESCPRDLQPNTTNAFWSKQCVLKFFGSGICVRRLNTQREYKLAGQLRTSVLHAMQRAE